jgi:hypothetical protein
MVSQLSALETLVPPNFITTQGDSAISFDAPSVVLEQKCASCKASSICMFNPICGKKKPARDILAGLLTMSRPYC